MNIHHGTTRTVITIPSLGIAIKIARIEFKLAFSNLIYSLIRDPDVLMLKIFFRREFFSVSPMTFWYFLFCGLLSNLNEWWFTIRYGSDFIAPTYFSCGLFSVIRCVDPIPTCATSLKFGRKTYGLVSSVVAHADIDNDTHHWGVSRNFGLLRGKVVMCDYGSPKTREILRKHAKQLAKLDLASVLQQDS